MNTRRKTACLQSAMAEPIFAEPTYSLDRQIAQARREMGEDRWRELNAEWAALNTPEGDE